MLLIIGYFGVGKSTLMRNDNSVADLTDMGQPSLSLLKDTIEKYDIVLADPQWEMVILESGMPFYVVVPTLDRKEEFLKNYHDRWEKGLGGGAPPFCKLMDKVWDVWIPHLASLPSMGVIELEKGEFLADALSHLSAHHTD